MKSLAQIFERYRGVDCHSGTDKGSIHSYIEVYEEVLAPYRRDPACRVCEIGIMTGDSLLMLEEYFGPQAEVWGIDICDRPVGGIADLRLLIASGQHKIVLLDATDKAQLEKAFKGVLFDVVIEDASHLLDDQLKIYENFKPYLAPGFLYVVEDVDNLDTVRPLFEGIDPEKPVRIVDRRAIKGRFDDVLVLIGGPQ